MPARFQARSQTRLRSIVVLTLAAVALSTVLAACEPTLQQDTGIVVGIDSPALGRVDSFELLTTDGERVVFDTSELAFRPEFPVSHLAEHQVLSDPITVTYKTDDDRLVVTQLDDAE